MTSTVKIRKSTFKKAEEEWSSYYDTLKEIARLREEIIHPHEEEEDEPGVIAGANSVRTPGDPTGKMATRLTTNRQLNYLTSIVEAIESVYNALPDDYRKLVRLRYWNKHRNLDWEGIALECNVSKRKAFYMRKEIIQGTIELLGWR